MQRSNERLNEEEVAEWTASLDAVIQAEGSDVALQLVEHLRSRAHERGARGRRRSTTPYVNTIPQSEQPPYPGKLDVERRLRNLVRYNAMAMVVRANRDHEGIGGHISTYASCSTLYEVALNHVLHRDDVVYFQGHASPGLYARAYVEGRLSDAQMHRFRRECEGGGLSSYPHPWLMPDFWAFPTVSMGLSPLMAMYQARFEQYLARRGLVDEPKRVWCFIGDGECDEPETFAGASLAGREGLDNLVLVVNCNLQRLDGPVRGNGKVVQELEARFAGCGWDVVKVLWGSDWDPLLERDRHGALAQRMMETVDGDYQRYVVADGSVIRDEFFGGDERLEELVAHLSDEQLERLGRGGHDPTKIYAAYQRAMAAEGRPTVILAKTIKGYGLGEAGEGRNVTHQQKKLNEEELLEFRSRFGVPLSDEQVADAALYRPEDDSSEVRYAKERREALGGPLPGRDDAGEVIEAPELALFEELLKGSGEREASTTMAFVRLLRRLLDHDSLGERVVPIVPDEARTFGMETLFRRYGIYAARGQRYTPVDEGKLSEYREASDGQILEEGITEAGAMASFIAAGTAYATHGMPMLPLYAFYSMFGFQRVGDLIWAAADARARGFLIGATAGRTTLNGEGLQHQDGHSHLLAAAIPTVRAYDPAFAYELAVIVQDGLRRMLTEREPLMVYLTVYNEPLAMPAMPDGAEEGIRRGIHPIAGDEDADVEILASGSLVTEALRARDLLGDLDLTARVWSVTSWSELRRDALGVERHQRLHPDDGSRRSYLDETFEGVDGPFVLVSDWVRLVPDQITRFLPGETAVLGTDGFGRSDTRATLRRHFEVSAEHVAYAALAAARPDDTEVLSRAREAFEIDPDTPNPVQA